MDIWLNSTARSWLGGQRVDCRTFHARLPGYRQTPLHRCASLARRLGVGLVLVKDESRRFDLPAFKMLGASRGVYKALCERLGTRPRWQNIADLRQHLAASAPTRQLHLLTATAGNHGHAVARMGRWLGLRTLALLPAGTAADVVSAIASEDADVRILDGSYDEAVAVAADLAKADDRYLLVQDTAWPGYERVPGWIVEGYQTLFHELDEQLGQFGRNADAVVVPVGVGSLMSAAIQYYRAPVPPRPALVGVEPVSAACALASLHAGRRVTVPTATTVMAGLNAGTVSSTAWPLLRHGPDVAVAVTDAAVEEARLDLAALDIGVGHCGAATLAGMATALSGDAGTSVREVLGLTSTSTVVLVATDAYERGAPPAASAPV